MLKPKKKHRNGMVLNCKEAPLDVDVDVKNGGRVVVLNTKNLMLVGEVNLAQIWYNWTRVPCARLDSRVILSCK